MQVLKFGPTECLEIATTIYVKLFLKHKKHLLMNHSWHSLSCFYVVKKISRGEKKQKQTIDVQCTFL